MREKCFVIFFCAIAYFVVQLDAQICQRVQLVTSMVQVRYTTSYRVTYHGQCYYGCILTKWTNSVERRTVPKREWKITKFCCTGYIRKDDSADDDDIVCEPICMPACKNGRCKTPGECECNNGYIPDPEDDHNCLPSCKKGCEHGTCVAPDKCQCNFGYIFVNGTCQPVCTDPCHNGTCIAPEKCECLVGYRKSENNLCQPYCSHGCDNGYCVAPETCQCYSGWDLKETKYFPYKHCVPVCSKPCENGECVAPETCDCWYSYKKSEGGCVPVCLDGWVLENGRCVAQCSHPCGNGTCVAPNVCACHSGYHMDTNYTFSYNLNPNATICVPTCTECAGHCYAPNKCKLELTPLSLTWNTDYYDYYYNNFIYSSYEDSTAATETIGITPRTIPTTTSTARPRTIPTTTSTARPRPIPTTTSTGRPRTIPTTTSTGRPRPIPTTTSTGRPRTIPTTTSTARPRTIPTTTSTARPRPIPTTTSTARPRPIPTTTSTGRPRYPKPTTTTTMSTITKNPHLIETNAGELKNSWFEEHWMSVFMPVLVIITTVIITLLLLIWRYTPIRSFFKGRSYVVAGDPVQTASPPQSGDIEISDVKI